MAGKDYKARLNGFIFKTLLFLCVFLGIYGFYLFSVYKNLHKMKSEVTSIYELFAGTGGQNSSQPAPQETPKSRTWTQINARTSDAKIEQLSNMSDKEIKDKVSEVEGFEKMLDGNSVKLLNFISNLLSKQGGQGGTPVISPGDEKDIKEMISKIVDDYQKKQGTEPGK
jgi:hypothetical protein